jgi:hypothetical protein
MNRRNISMMILTLAAALMAGCNPQLDSSVATFNANATLAANVGSGMSGTLSVTAPAATAAPSATPTAIPNTYDLTADATQSLAKAWGQTYGLPAGQPFMIKATQQQVGDYMVQVMQLSGWSNTVKAGNVVISAGQLRLDVAILDTAGTFGTGTVTFQPTLDSTSTLRLNGQGGQFGTLQLPAELYAAFGDAVMEALAGAKTPDLSKVTLTLLSLDGGIMQVVGTTK